jgi:hypothetical protein
LQRSTVPVELVLAVLVLPLVGALWGSAIAAAIHFTANGVLLGIVFAALAKVFGAH